MFPYDDFSNGFYGGLPASSMAWMLFTESGEPGYYMLYRDLLDAEKEDTTLE